MKTRRYDKGDREREIAAALALNSSVLGRVAARWEGAGLFSSPWANVVGQLCVDHYKKYGKAPRKGVVSLFREWAQSGRDDATVALVEKFLGSLDAAQKVNPELMLDLAGKHFNEVRVAKLKEELDADLEAGKLEAAEARLIKAASARVELGVGAGVDLFADVEAASSTYDKELREPLIVFDGALGRFFGDQLGRDCFVAFMGPEKGGKSYWLMELAFTAMMQRRKVAYFQAGDMSEHQIKDRFLVRAAGHPSRSARDDGKWPCVVKWPVRLSPPPKGTGEDDKPRAAVVEFDELPFKMPLAAKKGWAEEVLSNVQKQLKSKQSFFRLSCHADNTISVHGIRSILEGWALDGWRPEVVVVDYADLLAPCDRKEDSLKQIETTWGELRKLSQELHCLLVSASQVKATAYGKRTMDKSDFQGNHLKFAKVTSMFGINVTAEEKERQLCRLNNIIRREGGYSVRRCVHVAQCLDLACPAVLSIFPKGGS